MAVTTPREEFLAIGRARHCGAVGCACQRASRDSFEALSQVDSGASRSRVSEYLRIVNPTLHLTVEFGCLVHPESWKPKKRAARKRYEASVSVH